MGWFRRILCWIGLHGWDEQTRFSHDHDRTEYDERVEQDWGGVETIRVVERCIYCKRKRHRDFRERHY